MNEMRDLTKENEGQDFGDRLEHFLRHEDTSFDIFKVKKEDRITADKLTHELVADLNLENSKDKDGIQALQFGDFDVRMQIVDDAVEVGAPIVCRIFIESEIFKVVDIHIEVRVNGTLVDSFDQERVKCDTEHKIAIRGSTHAGEGEILLITSPPGSRSGSKWREKLLVKAVERADERNPDISVLDEKLPDGLNEEDVREMREIKEIADEWQQWKNTMTGCNDEMGENLKMATLKENRRYVEPCSAILEADIYQDVLKIADKYMEKAEKFVSRQVKDQIGATPDTLALDNVKDLAECMGRSASLLIGKEKAMKMKEDILNLRSLYLFASNASSDEGKIL
ncbi:MAG: hypothetical protein OCU18_04365 [Candidatus Syntrophoarchaeum sp.]|nr:hypothetical protein [Candidatus Syntrophoarchaeum sp.]